jgi:hypothetical protein
VIAPAGQGELRKLNKRKITMSLSQVQKHTNERPGLSRQTVVLVLVYFAGVVLLQQLFQSLTGQGSALAITGSTLGIVVLFQPLRTGLQTIIDRRFYRRKYDAARVLAAFDERLQRREDMDLKTLSDDLLAVIQTTMEPTHVSLWLCQPAFEDTADQDTTLESTRLITRLLKDTIKDTIREETK